MHPNEKLLRDSDEAQLREDSEALLATMADDLVVHVSGQSSLAGVYKGKDQFAELFERFMAATPEYTFEPHAYFADDEHGTVIQRSHYSAGVKRSTPAVHSSSTSTTGRSQRCGC